MVRLSTTSCSSNFREWVCSRTAWAAAVLPLRWSSCSVSQVTNSDARYLHPIFFLDWRCPPSLSYSRRRHWHSSLRMSTTYLKRLTDADYDSDADDDFAGGVPDSTRSCPSGASRTPDCSRPRDLRPPGNILWEAFDREHR